MWTTNCVWTGVSLGDRLFLLSPSLYWHSPLSKMDSRGAQSIGQVGFQDGRLIRSWTELQSFPLGVRRSSAAGRVSNRRAVATSGQKQRRKHYQEDWPTTASSEANGQDFRSSPLSCHSVLPDRGSRHSHPRRREVGEQKATMPDSRAGQKASQPAPAHVPTVSRAQGAQGQAGSVVALPAPPPPGAMGWPPGEWRMRSIGPAVLRHEFKTSDTLVMWP